MFTKYYPQKLASIGNIASGAGVAISAAMTPLAMAKGMSDVLPKAPKLEENTQYGDELLKSANLLAGANGMLGKALTGIKSTAPAAISGLTAGGLLGAYLGNRMYQDNIPDVKSLPRSNPQHTIEPNNERD